jgi:hypothetical protein
MLASVIASSTGSSVLVGLIAAGASLIGSGIAAAILTAVLTSRLERQQQIREFLVPPSVRFAEAALIAFARLRAVKPPTPAPAGRLEHRNEQLLFQPEEARERLQTCAEAIDAVRQAHGAIRLVFAPNNAAVTDSRGVLVAQRRMLEVAESFYQRCHASDHDDASRLRGVYEPSATRAWKQLRDGVGWLSFNRFVSEVSRSLQKPKWKDPLDFPVPIDSDQILTAFNAEVYEARSRAR